MEFIAERKDFSVAELYEKFSCYFPTIVIVNVGFCGEEDGDCFDRGQILRIQTVSKQQRVLARLKEMKEQKDYSIPVNYQEPMSVVDKYGNVGETQPLYKIMQRNMTLPITVQFPRNRTITVGYTTISTNQIPKMELVDVFDEVYLLGNYISNDGEVSTDVVQVPLYLSDLRLSIVKEIKGKPFRYWLSYVEKLNYKCSGVQYDVKFGNPDIAVYKTGAFQAKKEYACVEPIHYVNLVELFSKPCADAPEQLHNDDAEANIYEPVSYTSDQKSSHDKYTTFSQEHGKLLVNKLKNKLQLTFTMDKKKDDTAANSEFNTVPRQEPPRTLKTGFRRIFKPKSNEEKAETKRPPVAPKPVRPKDSSISNVGEQPNKNVDETVFMSHLELKVPDHQEKTKYEPTPKEGKTPVNVPTMYVHPQHKFKTIEEQEIQGEDIDAVYENLTLSGNSSNIHSTAVIEPQLPSTVVHNTALPTGNKTIGRRSTLHSSVDIEPQMLSTVVHNTALRTGNKSIERSSTLHSPVDITTQLPSAVVHNSALQTGNKPIGRSSTLHSSVDITTQLPSASVHNTALPTGNKTIDVSKLSISELGHYMKLLKLDKYVEVFSENMVDGSTLLDLPGDVLHEEFALSRFQAIRLMKFAKEGHLPS